MLLSYYNIMLSYDYIMLLLYYHFIFLYHYKIILSYYYYYIILLDYYNIFLLYYYTIIRHRAARHARACSIHPSGGLMSDVLRGPQPRIGFYCIPCFHHFFGLIFECLFGAKWSSPGNPKSLEIQKNRVSEVSLRALLKKTLK